MIQRVRPKQNTASLPHRPIVMVTSWERNCGIYTFADEAIPFIREHLQRHVEVVTFTDSPAHPDIFPVINPASPFWPQDAADFIAARDPYVVHLQHEYALYVHERKDGDVVDKYNKRFLRLLHYLKERKIPTVVEPHTIHTRTREGEEEFLRGLFDLAGVVLLKNPDLEPRLGWMLYSDDTHEFPNAMIVPHGAHPGYQHLTDVDTCRRLMGLEDLTGKMVIGFVGSFARNKSLHILLNIFPALATAIERKTGKKAVLLIAGQFRGRQDEMVEHWIHDARELERRGLVRFAEVHLQSEPFFMSIGACDIVVIPSIDETQSGSFARVVAVGRPMVAYAFEGLGLQSIRSGAAIPFTRDEEGEDLSRKILDLALHPRKRQILAANARHYLRREISWKVVVRQYAEAYRRSYTTVHPVHREQVLQKV